MPRSYRFDHFTSQKHDTHWSLREEDKRRFVESQPKSGSDTLHYGKSHRETEELATAKAMNTQLEELAKPALEQESKFSQPLPGAVPIGALPPTQEPPPRVEFSQIWDHAGEQVKIIRSDLQGLIRASRQLGFLPWKVARVTVQRLLLRGLMRWI